MKYGLDTSVVLRLLVGEPVAQARAARRRVERALSSGDAIVVSDLVVAETYFALHYHYGVPKDEARAMLHAMLTSGSVELTPREALVALEPSSGAGLVDRLVAARYRTEGAATWTFDRKLAALEGARRL